jgi:hypothetical protein
MSKYVMVHYCLLLFLSTITTRDHKIAAGMTPHAVTHLLRQEIHQVNGPYLCWTDSMCSANLNSVEPERLRTQRQLLYEIQGHAFAIGLDIKEKAESWGGMTHRRFGIRKDGDTSKIKFKTLEIQCLGPTLVVRMPQLRMSGILYAVFRVTSQWHTKALLGLLPWSHSSPQNRAR